MYSRRPNTFRVNFRSQSFLEIYYPDNRKSSQTPNDYIQGGEQAQVHALMELIRKTKPLEEAVEELRRLFETNKEKPVLFLSSGGSALKMLDYDLPVPKNLTLSVLDERWSADPKVNNFLQFEETKFFKKALISGAKIIRTVPLQGENLTQTAERFEQELKSWRKAYQNGVIIVTMGIGEDGHTAGIFPMPEAPMKFKELFLGERWVVGYDVGSKNQYPLRVTVTYTFLRMIDAGVLLATGKTKKDLLSRTEGNVELSLLPVAIIKNMKIVKIFVD